jgi:hypothetical protein
VISETELRRCLSWLRRPDRLGSTELGTILRARGLVSTTASDLSVGKATAHFLAEAIERVRPPQGAEHDQQLPHLVLKTCFLDGAKMFLAAQRLGLSERQLTRERAWAIGLLLTEVESALNAAAPVQQPTGRVYRSVPIPVLADCLPRPALKEQLQRALFEHQVVVVAGPAGVGKTSLVADVASSASEAADVIWYRFRLGVNDSLKALLFEIAERLAGEGNLSSMPTSGPHSQASTSRSRLG